jgi:hypothetical protein
VLRVQACSVVPAEEVHQSRFDSDCDADLFHRWLRVHVFPKPEFIKGSRFRHSERVYVRASLSTENDIENDINFGPSGAGKTIYVRYYICP